MSPTEFCYWLQGYMEISDSRGLSEPQVKTIRNHLDLVFTKVTPAGDSEQPVSEMRSILGPLDFFCNPNYDIERSDDPPENIDIEIDFRNYPPRSC